MPPPNMASLTVSRVIVLQSLETDRYVPAVTKSIYTTRAGPVVPVPPGREGKYHVQGGESCRLALRPRRPALASLH